LGAPKTALIRRCGHRHGGGGYWPRRDTKKPHFQGSGGRFWCARKNHESRHGAAPRGFGRV